VRANSYLRYACTGLESTNRGFHRLSSIRLAHGLLLTIGALLFLRLNVLAQTPDSQTTEEANKSWTAVTDLRSSNIAPARVVESHSQIGNRTVDKRSLQIRWPRACLRLMSRPRHARYIELFRTQLERSCGVASVCTTLARVCLPSEFSSFHKSSRDLYPLTECTGPLYEPRCACPNSVSVSAHIASVSSRSSGAPT
jgi:hypothetical protein